MYRPHFFKSNSLKVVSFKDHLEKTIISLGYMPDKDKNIQSAYVLLDMIMQNFQAALTEQDGIAEELLKGYEGRVNSIIGSLKS